METKQKDNPTVDILKQVHLLIDESMQVYELENEKTNAINDLFASLKVVTQYLGFSVSIHPGLFGLKSDSQVIMTPSLELIFLHADGKSEIKKLDTYEPEIIVQCLDYIIPQLVEMVRREKVSLTQKMEYLRSVSQRIQQVHTLAKTAHAPELVENHDSGE